MNAKLQTETKNVRIVALERLMQKLNVPDVPALLATPQYQTAYSAAQSKAPGEGTTSLRQKAVDDMLLSTAIGVTLDCHVLVPIHELFMYDKAAKKRKLVAYGLLVATPSGDTKFIKQCEGSATRPTVSLLPGAKTGDPCQLVNVDVTDDHYNDEVRITYSKNSKVTAGGHARPFPEGPDLDRVLGKTAQKEGFGPYRVRKDTGAMVGKEPDRGGREVTIFVGTTGTHEQIKVRNFDSDPPSAHHVAVPVFDRHGTGTQVKLPFDWLEQYANLQPRAMPRELLAVKLAQRRVIVAAHVGIFHPRSTKDFGGDEAFASIIADMEKNGQVVARGGSGDGSTLRQFKPNAVQYVVDANDPESAYTLPYVTIGDKRVYSLEEKPDHSWDIGVMASDEKGKGGEMRLPWATINSKKRTDKDDTNPNAFFVFLDGGEADADDPIRALLSQYG